MVEIDVLTLYQTSVRGIRNVRRPTYGPDTQNDPSERTVSSRFYAQDRCVKLLNCI
jgi:hypothetical protein